MLLPVLVAENVTLEFCMAAQTKDSPLSFNYFPHLFQLTPGFANFHFFVVDLSNHALCEVKLLRLDHFVADSADVKKTEEVDFEDLRVVQLLEGVLEFTLLPT